MLLEMHKSTKARRIPFAWSDQERVRKSGSFREGGWQESALWGNGAGCAKAWRGMARSLYEELNSTV